VSSGLVRLCAGRTAAAALAATIGLGVPAGAGASGFHLFRSTGFLQRGAEARREEFTLGACCDPVLARAAGDAPISLALDFPAVPAIDLAALDPPAPIPRVFAPPPPRPKLLAVGLVSAAAIWGSAYNAYTDGPDFSFHFTNEGYFGRHTYVGGGDKASHLVSYYAVSRILTSVYEMLDVPEDKAYGLGAAISTTAGLATEIGDGTNKYGFSYEDFVVDAVGAASAYLLARHGLDDLIGFRAGIVPAPDADDLPRVPGIGKDYTKEIYTADLKLAGLARRLDRRFGPARFLLVSVTYGVKGYPYAEPALRERQVGLEVGLNLAEAARALGVPRERWWGKALLLVLDVVRVPYTAVGVRYDINHRRWHGPDTGDSFPIP
jgi:hypothetical protein